MSDVVEVIVDGIWRQGSQSLAVRLVAQDGRPLPAWQPGAHIDVHLPCVKAGKKRGDLIAIQRQLRHVALIACLTAYRKLGKPSLAHITQAITFRLIDQTHLMNLRIIRPRPLVTLGDRDRFLSANPSGITQQAN